MLNQMAGQASINWQLTKAELLLKLGSLDRPRPSKSSKRDGDAETVGGEQTAVATCSPP
jgi:hypothetical protein